MQPGTTAGPRRRRMIPAVAATLGLLASLVMSTTGTATATPAAPASASTSVVATAVTATDVGRPSWWDGDCDANRFNRIAASFGWDGVGVFSMTGGVVNVPGAVPRLIPSAVLVATVPSGDRSVAHVGVGQVLERDRQIGEL